MKKRPGWWFLWKTIDGIMFLIFVTALFIWVDHCNAGGKVTRSIKETFVGK